MVQPAVDVLIDGKPAGRSPVKAKVSPGRHRVTLADKAAGINLTRTVLVERTGVTPLDVQIGKAGVTVDGPVGSKVFIDGKLSGTLPLAEDISIYEGAHRIKVDMGQGSWQQDFSVKADERMQFQVGLEERELPTP